MNLLTADNARENLTLVRRVARRLKRARKPSALPEAERIVRHYAKMDRVAFYAGDRRVGAQARRRIEKALKARLEGRALGQVLNSSFFYGHEFFINAHVLVPRPETEVLVEETLKLRRAARLPADAEILDLGTGSGCLAVCLTMEWPECRMTALDVSEKALSVARKNSRIHKLEKKISFVKSDLFSKVPGRCWDAIVSNPPYVPGGELPKLSREVRGEPALALDGGPEGLKVITTLLDQAKRHLKPGGYLLMEIGSGQSETVRARLAHARWVQEFSFVRDLSGVERVAVIRNSVKQNG